MGAAPDTIELPFITQIAEMVNRHLARLHALDIATTITPSENDEQEILCALMGLSRLIEHNARIVYERLAKSLGLQDRHYRYGKLLDAMKPYAKPAEYHQLLVIASHISNELVHSNFGEVYNKTKAAYEINGMEFHQDEFTPLAIEFETTITRYGLHVDLEKLEAHDSHGNPIPFRPRLPGYGHDIAEDFLFFYRTGCFLFTYDVLLTAYKPLAFIRHRPSLGT